MGFIISRFFSRISLEKQTSEYCLNPGLTEIFWSNVKENLEPKLIPGDPELRSRRFFVHHFTTEKICTIFVFLHLFLITFIKPLLQIESFVVIIYFKKIKSVFKSSHFTKSNLPSIFKINDKVFGKNGSTNDSFTRDRLPRNLSEFVLIENIGGK